VQKSLFLLLFLLVLPLHVFSAPAVTPEVLVYDFGDVIQGDKISYTFRFKNNGDELLEISSVSSSCGCTAALLSSKRIAPGDMGEIKATFDSSRFRGDVTKTITMHTNSPDHSQVQFKLKGKVKELLSISTNRISWNWATSGLTAQSTVVIRNQSQQKIVLQEATSTSPQVTAILDQLELAPGEKATLSVSGYLGAGEERLNGYLLVSTDFKPMPQLRISVSGRLVK
jgi:hypothetical protein